jgi:excisionase family DNA binding protein
MAKLALNRYENTISESGPLMDPRTFGLVKAAYSVDDTIDLLSIGRTTFYALVGRGELKITKLGKKSLVYATDIAALLTKLRSTEN